MTKFSKGDKLMCVRSSTYDYGPNVEAGKEYECNGSPTGEPEYVYVVGGAGYRFLACLFTSGRTVKMFLATTTYQIAEVPFNEAIDPDHDWESWNWKPYNKKPDHFIRPSNTN